MPRPGGEVSGPNPCLAGRQALRRSYLIFKNFLPGGVVVTRLPLEQKFLGSIPSPAAVKKKRKLPQSFFRIFIILSAITLVFTLGYTWIAHFTYTYPCANSITCAKDLTGMYDTKKLTGVFNGKQITIPPQTYIPGSFSVLGDAVPSNKHMYVDLSKQRLYAYEGNTLVYSFLVSTGLWNRTPTGDFKIWTKLAKTTMAGGSKALGTYYYLPNVPCTMYFYKGYGIHGTYWHNNFGHPMSHGCVNMKTDEACTLFSWASVGTRVNIHY